MRVGCLVAGADEEGALSVGALRAAITGHGGGGSFGWLGTVDGGPGTTPVTD